MMACGLPHRRVHQALLDRRLFSSPWLQPSLTTEVLPTIVSEWLFKGAPAMSLKKVMAIGRARNWL
jgi:hypothetical protein